MRGPRHSRDAGDDGAVAILLALMLVVFVGAAAMAIDLGSAWETKRDLVTDTDAGALAGARLLSSIGLDDCDTTEEDVFSEAANVVALNDPETIVVSEPEDIRCPGEGEQHAVVPVEATQAARGTLTGAAGGGDLAARSRSSAIVGPASMAYGLLPIAFCEQLPGIAGYLEGEEARVQETSVSERGTEDRYPASTFDGLSYAAMGAGLVHQLDHRPLDGAASCGATDGTWGWQSFHSVSTGTADCASSPLDDIGAMICQGYAGGVALGTPPAFTDRRCGIVDASETGPADSRPDDHCFGDLDDPTEVAEDHAQLRSSWLCRTSREACVADGKVFTVMVYDQVLRGPGEPGDGGADDLFRPVAFMGMILRDNAAISRPEDDEDEDGDDEDGEPFWALHVEFVSSQVDGRVGEVRFPTGVTTYELCGADGAQNCQP